MGSLMSLSLFLSLGNDRLSLSLSLSLCSSPAPASAPPLPYSCLAPCKLLSCTFLVSPQFLPSSCPPQFGRLHHHHQHLMTFFGTARAAFYGIASYLVRVSGKPKVIQEAYFIWKSFVDGMLFSNLCCFSIRDFGLSSFHSSIMLDILILSLNFSLLSLYLIFTLVNRCLTSQKLL